MITRALYSVLEEAKNRGKIMVLIGPRQVGKTTLLKQFLRENQKNLMLNCDDIEDVAELENRSSAELKSLIEGYDTVFIDEAQRVSNIGMTLKKIGDLKLSTRVFVSGSSSLELADNINESATGRLIEYELFPISLQELMAHSSVREEKKNLAQRLVYGLYPDVVNDPAFAKQTLSNLTNHYLYKDILAYKGIKKTEMLQKLVRALAYQIGSEVNYNELSGLLGIDKETVEKYIVLLEKCYIVFRLESYNRNMRTELKKGKKIYFYDNGIRNAIINNFTPLELRNDVGALWENLMISERVKHHAYQQTFTKIYFWRTHAQQEIDLIEEVDGQMKAFEFKYNPKKKAKLPKSFIDSYPDTTFEVITPENYQDFV